MPDDSFHLSIIHTHKHKHTTAIYKSFFYPMVIAFMLAWSLIRMTCPFSMWLVYVCVRFFLRNVNPQVNDFYFDFNADELNVEHN